MSVTKRGRRSSADLSIVPVTPLGAVERVRPPADLTDEQVEVWVAVVNSQAADWFDESTAPLLAQYCRHVIEAKRLARMREQSDGFKEFSLEDLDLLLRMQERESRAVAMLATKMRLSQQSTTNHRGNKKPTAARKLWE